MPAEFYILSSCIVLFVLGTIWFAGWWNKRQGADDRGNPIKPPRDS